MIKELDCVALTRALPEFRLEAGDVGAVVHVAGGGEQYIVEFITFGGETVAIPTVSKDESRPIAPNELHHTRQLKTA